MNDLMEMNRRAMLCGAMLLVGATVIPAGCSLTDGAGRDFSFDAAQLALVTAMADTIVPKGDTVGALDADVPKNLEALLNNWASDERLEEILAGLGRVDEAANKTKSKDFAALDAATRLEVLKAHEVEAMKPAPEKASGEGGVTMMMGPPATDKGYAKIRELIVKLFYYSEPALTQELRYEHDPGEYISSVPVTPETRPGGGLSPI
ncbi:MAG: gluconate 2-dehydrogenase subunit 3 family protein [Novosphingobium sp.]|nr:gluconate 2-dehydrogenase subunit 3 family protein [Novosphingobium sp.]